MSRNFLLVCILAVSAIDITEGVQLSNEDVEYITSLIKRFSESKGEPACHNQDIRA